MLAANSGPLSRQSLRGPGALLVQGSGALSVLGGAITVGPASGWAGAPPSGPPLLEPPAPVALPEPPFPVPLPLPEVDPEPPISPRPAQPHAIKTAVLAAKRQSRCIRPLLGGEQVQGGETEINFNVMAAGVNLHRR